MIDQWPHRAILSNPLSFSSKLVNEAQSDWDLRVDTVLCVSGFKTQVNRLYMYYVYHKVISYTHTHAGLR